MPKSVNAIFDRVTFCGVVFWIASGKAIRRMPTAMNYKATHVLSSLCLSICFWAVCAHGQTLKVLHSFGAPGDGAGPSGGLAMGSRGNFYGVTSGGGTGRCGCGTAFELSPNADGSWTETVIYNFQGYLGDFPNTKPAFDKKGNLYGTADMSQTLFELIPGSGGMWSEIVVWAGTSHPTAVSFDNAGNLYGTAYDYGLHNAGYVFVPSKLNYYGQVILYAFTGGNDGNGPTGEYAFDAAGSLYGTTLFGGANGSGTVFQLTPNHGLPGWHETTLYGFQGAPFGTGSDGADPYASVVFDAAGNLYGTTEYGGPAGLGTVYKLSPNGDGTWTETVLHAFQGSDGAYPDGTVTFDAAGNLYSTTTRGGTYDVGVVFKLSPGTGGQWTESILHSFADGSDGAVPTGGVVLDAPGNIYGITGYGGPYQPGGVAFEITP
jgi:uncharacterized repeat protein (TIGR03803 family)